jgi:hypothetical protein
MKKSLVTGDVALHHVGLRRCGQLAVGMMLALSAACGSAPSAPATLPAIAPTAPPEPSPSANEPYEGVVKTGNQRFLHDAAVPFATYINTIHVRIHPLFADAMTAFEAQAEAPGRPGDLVTVIEMALDLADGRLVRLGLIRASGVTAFDVAVLNAVNHAQPFGKAPDVVVSADGKVYLHWEFHRDRNDACTTRNAFPYLLTAAP